MPLIAATSNDGLVWWNLFWQTFQQLEAIGLGNASCNCRRNPGKNSRRICISPWINGTQCICLWITGWRLHSHSQKKSLIPHRKPPSRFPGSIELKCLSNLTCFTINPIKNWFLINFALHHFVTWLAFHELSEMTLSVVAFCKIIWKESGRPSKETVHYRLRWSIG